MPGDSRGTVLVISPSIGIGGREKIAINTVRSFERLGYHAILVIFQRCGVEYPFHGEMINLNVPAKKNAIGKITAQIRRSIKLLHLRKKYKTQFAYSLGDASNIANVLSGITHLGKSIISLHVFGEVNKSIVSKFIFHKADKLICIAQDMRHYLLMLYPRLKNVTVIENGYELSQIDRKEMEASSFPRLVVMGRLTKQKGLSRLIKALKMVRQSIPDAKLTIVGKGELEAELKALADRLELRNAVAFQGYLSNPIPVLQASDIYTMTSYSEGFPNALIEALNCGLPVVAADCRSGPREILSATYMPEPIQGIKHEKYGVLVEESADGFEERFAEAVLQLWNNKKEMAYYRETAPQRAKDFSLERYQEKLKKLLDDCGYESTQ